MNQTIEDGLVINKSSIMIQHLKPENKYDLVYFDAFGPRVEDKLWDISVLKLIFNLMNNDGVLLHIVQKGQVRRDLEQIGFSRKASCPPGKREMLRATKMNNGTQSWR